MRSDDRRHRPQGVGHERLADIEPHAIYSLVTVAAYEIFDDE